MNNLTVTVDAPLGVVILTCVAVYFLLNVLERLLKLGWQWLQAHREKRSQLPTAIREQIDAEFAAAMERMSAAVVGRQGVEP